MIGFEAGSNWFDVVADLHTFRGKLDGGNIRCVISQIALRELAGDGERGEAPLRLFERLEYRVFQLAERKFRTSGPNAHGTIAISSMDLPLLKN